MRLFVYSPLNGCAGCGWLYKVSGFSGVEILMKNGKNIASEPMNLKVGREQ